MAGQGCFYGLEWKLVLHEHGNFTLEGVLDQMLELLTLRGNANEQP